MKYLLSVILMLCSIAVHAGGVTVLMYHRIQPTPAHLDVTLDGLRDHLDAIKAAGYKTITIAELAKHMRNGVIPRKTVAITVDDGWKETTQFAAELSARKMTGTFFIISKAFDNPLYLTRDEVKALSKSFEIGAHSHTHFMKYIDDLKSMDPDMVQGELALSKILIEQVIGKPVTTFCWPFGHFTDKGIAAAREVGYSATTIVSGKTTNERNDPFKIDRVNADGRCTGAEIVKSIETGVPCK
jgi:peptidoglycan/xylan/chitin deacetylase (PgdA/CDA1 family)